MYVCVFVCLLANVHIQINSLALSQLASFIKYCISRRKNIIHDAHRICVFVRAIFFFLSSIAQHSEFIYRCDISSCYFLSLFVKPRIVIAIVLLQLEKGKCTHKHTLFVFFVAFFFYCRLVEKKKIMCCKHCFVMFVLKERRNDDNKKMLLPVAESLLHMAILSRFVCHS